MIKIHRGSIKKITGIIEEKTMLLRSIAINSSNIVLKTRLRSLQVRLNNSIECAKENFTTK